MANCSNCLLTSGLNNNCKVKPIGGNNQILYIIPTCQIAAYVDTYTNNVIDDITLEAGATWFKFSARKDSVSTTETVTLPNKFITQTVVFALSNYSDNVDIEVAYQEAADTIQEMVDQYGGFTVAVKDANGVWRLFGKTVGLEVTAGEKVSGLTIADVAGNTITLSGGESQYAPALVGTYTFP